MPVCAFALKTATMRAKTKFSPRAQSNKHRRLLGRADRSFRRNKTGEEKLAAAEPFGHDRDQREGMQFSKVATAALRALSCATSRAGKHHAQFVPQRGYEFVGA